MRDVMQETKWHVVYTMPRSEKKFAARVGEMGIESFLPLCNVTRQWSDRRRTIEIPLFPNYVFVKVNDIMRSTLYSVRALVRVVSVDKRPVIVQEKEIETIKRLLKEDESVVPEDYFHCGMLVKIKLGPLAGLEGVVIRKNNTARLVIKIDGLMKAYSVSVSHSFIEALK